MFSPMFLFVLFGLILSANLGITAAEKKKNGLNGDVATIRCIIEKVVTKIDKDLRCQENREEIDGIVKKENQPNEPIPIDFKKLCELNEKIGQTFGEILEIKEKNGKQVDGKIIERKIETLRNKLKAVMDAAKEEAGRKLTPSEKKKYVDEVKRDYLPVFMNKGRKKLQKHLNKMVENAASFFHGDKAKLGYFIQYIIIIEQMDTIDRMSGIGKLNANIRLIGYYIFGVGVQLAAAPLYAGSALCGLGAKCCPGCYPRA